MPVFGWITFLGVVSGSATSGAESQQFQELRSLILNLPEGAVLPQEIVKRYDSKAVGRALVQRVRSRQLPVPHYAEEIPYDLMNETEIFMYFHSRDLPRILQKDQFENLHQSGQSSVVQGWGPLRAKNDDGIVGLKLEAQYNPEPSNKVHLIRTKSSWLHFNIRPRPNITGINKTGNGYGDIVAVLEEEVKNRSLIIRGGSLGPGNRNEEARSSFRTFLDGHIQLLIMNDEQTRNADGQGFEVITFGELLPKRDVKEYLVPQEIALPTLVELKTLGRPIYEYVQSGTDRIKGRRLFDARIDCLDFL